MERYTFLLALALWFNLTATGAETFKYQDQDGVIHYSDRPFRPGQKSLERQAGEWYHQMETEDSVPRESLLGTWTLYGIALNPDDPLTPDDDLWAFDDDGGFTTRGLQTFDIRAGFRLRGDTLETNEMGQWLPYRVVTLTDDQLVLENQTVGGFYYFRREASDPDPLTAGQIYGREEFARLATLAACIRGRHQRMDDEERTRLLLERVRREGITDFELDKFAASRQYYKTDREFVVNYQPEVTRRAFECVMAERQEN